jgi:hypothetical protein
MSFEGNRARNYSANSVSKLQVNTNTNILPSSDDTGRRRSLSDDFVGPNGPGSSMDWKLQFIALVEWMGVGKVLFFDPSTHILNAVLYSELVSEV